MRCGDGRRAFTLVELLVATSILLIFGVMAVTVLTYGTQLWRAGHRRSYAYDLATVVFQQIEDDLSAAQSQFWAKDEDAFDTRVKFWVDADAYDPDGGGGPLHAHPRHRIRFVRGIPDQSANPRIRQAGDGENNDGDASGPDEEYYNLKDDDDPLDARIDEDLMPLEGMCEVAYLLGLGADDNKTLYRAVLSPIGGWPAGGEGEPGHTFFDNDGDLDDVFGTFDRIQAKALPMAEDVLYFEVRLWTQYTTTWEDIGFDPWDQPNLPEPCGPVFTWDSDRLSGASTPGFYMDWGYGFTDPDTGVEVWADEDSDSDGDANSVDEDYVDDNVFPRAIRVVLVVDPTEEYPLPLRLELRNDVDASIGTGDMIYVRGTVPPYNPTYPYLRIDHEWVEFSDFVPDDEGGAFVVVERAARGTEKWPHDAGTEVKLGVTFARVFHNPASREYWEH